MHSRRSQLRFLGIPSIGVILKRSLSMIASSTVSRHRSNVGQRFQRAQNSRRARQQNVICRKWRFHLGIVPGTHRLMY